MKRRILVTGGAGFIGSALVRALAREEGVLVMNFDALTYAGHLSSLREVEGLESYRFLRGDVRDCEAVGALFRGFDPDLVFHLAAESHVDRSIEGPGVFVHTNTVGTFNMLQAALEHFEGLTGERRERFRFVHVSTDEVYGELGATGRFTEASQIRPSSPYSASKAAADMLVRAWHVTYGLPTITTNCSNNYGPHQHPEKLIPTMILSGAAGREMPIYGSGRQVRDWLHVDDHVRALRLIAERGRVGEEYLIGAECERQNVEVVAAICDLLDRVIPEGAPHAKLVRHVADRPGHDHRYAIDPGKLQAELGFKAKWGFKEGLEETVRWYLRNEWWWGEILAG